MSNRVGRIASAPGATPSQANFAASTESGAIASERATSIIVSVSEVVLMNRSGVVDVRGQKEIVDRAPQRRAARLHHPFVEAQRLDADRGALEQRMAAPHDQPRLLDADRQRVEQLGVEIVGHARDDEIEPGGEQVAREHVGAVDRDVEFDLRRQSRGFRSAPARRDRRPAP